MRDFKQLCALRHSVRAYKPDAVPAQALAYIQECVRLAPSAVNRQPWRFLTVGDDQGRALLQQCYARDWFCQAPTYILVCVADDEAWVRGCDGKSHADIDAAIAIEHLCLAAAEQGLGTCWVCNFDAPLCAQLMELPATWHPVAIVPIGYPATDQVPEKARKPLADIWSSR